MSGPALGLSKKPSLTQDREKLEKDQVRTTCHIIYWLFILSLFVRSSTFYGSFLDVFSVVPLRYHFYHMVYDFIFDSRQTLAKCGCQNML